MDISIVDCAMISGLTDLKTSCAAFRAGLNSFSASKEVHIGQRGITDPTPLAIAPLPPSFGFYQRNARFRRMFIHVIKELMPSIERHGIDFSQINIYCASPDPAHRLLLDKDSFLLDPGCFEEMRITFHFASLFSGALSDENISDGHIVHPFGFEQAAFINTLETALNDMEKEGSDYAIVMALDSLTDSHILRRLLEEDRIKTEMNPTGFIPGELAVAFLISRKNIAYTQRLDLRTAFEDDTFGEEMYAALHERLTEHNWRNQNEGTPEPLFYTSDLNGEKKRAEQLGMLQTRLVNTPFHMDQSNLIYPATGFGEVGAATGGLALAIAYRSIVTGWALSNEFMIVNFNDPDSVNKSHGFIYGRAKNIHREM